MNSIVFGTSVEYIDVDIFNGCDSLLSIACKSVNPPIVESDQLCYNSFDRAILYTEATLTYPAEGYKLYRKMEPWSNFDNQVGGQCAIKLIADAEKGFTIGSGTYNKDAQIEIAAIANTGYIFKKWSDGNTDNPRKVTVNSDFELTAEFEKVNGTDIDESKLTETNIYAYDNTIIVENADAEIRVYDAMGKLVAVENTENAEIQIANSGVYIVSVGNVAKRVMIQ